MSTVEVAVKTMCEAVERWQQERQEVRTLFDPYGVDVDAALGLLVAICDAEQVLGAWSADGLRAADRLLVLHGMPVELVAALAGVTVEKLEALSQLGRRNPKSRDVIVAHLDGKTVAQIVEETGVSKQLAYRWLRDAGLTPHRHKQVYPPSMRKRAAQMYRSKRTYSDMAKELRVPQQQVANLLRSAHRHGELPEYGERFASRVKSD
jgi:transposase-like protein